nr:MAG TPA: hypothetical protein [Caudoviricetes sp.]
MLVYSKGAFLASYSLKEDKFKQASKLSFY